jgi:hypothetical protein
MNPYNHNPYSTKPYRRERGNESDANRELAKTKRNDALSDTLLSIAHFGNMPKDKYGFWK